MFAKFNVCLGSSPIVSCSIICNIDDDIQDLSLAIEHILQLSGYRNGAYVEIDFQRRWIEIKTLPIAVITEKWFGLSPSLSYHPLVF